MISIDTVCLMGILVGQWLQFWVIWQLCISLREVLASMKTLRIFKPLPKEVILVPPEDFPDQDEGKITVHRRP